MSATGSTETAQVVLRRSVELTAIPLIVCSPVRRARETLAVLQQALPINAEVLFHDCLRSESSVQALEPFVDGLKTDSVLLISHQPLVGHLINYLTEQSGVGMSMGTSCLASLDLITFARGCGSLKWLDCPQPE